jgi:Ca-activated chloride channel family protein
MANVRSAPSPQENRDQRTLGRLAPFVVLAILASGIWYFSGDTKPARPAPVNGSFAILTGTENRILFDNPDTEEPTIMERFAEKEGIEFVPTYQGSVDTMIDLQNGAVQYDAVWPASSIWLDLGDTGNIVSREESIMGTPVVFGVKRSKAEELGWIGKDVSVDDILAAAESGQLEFLMSSATQSNSGAMAYLGYLSAFAGHPDVLTSDMLHDPAVVDKLTRILGEVDRTAGASGFLRDFFLDNYADYDAMVNNESAIITANQRLSAGGETDLLYVIYPVDGLAVADWPLGYVDHGDAKKSALFDRLHTYLKSPEVQAELVAQGRRTMEMGPEMSWSEVDKSVFNPDWGIDVERILGQIQLPSAEVILEALDLYQTAFRKPSFVVFCLDFSGSMEGSGSDHLKEAMGTLLDQETAGHYFMQRTPEDVTVVLPFSSHVTKQMRADGNDSGALQGLLGQIMDTGAGGKTNIYECLENALTFTDSLSGEYAPAIVLMTDGKSNQGSFSDFSAKLPQDKAEIVPVYSILFGDASRGQLEEIAEATNGDIYDGRDGLIKAMRDAFANA